MNRRTNTKRIPPRAAIGQVTRLLRKTAIARSKPIRIPKPPSRSIARRPVNNRTNKVLCRFTGCERVVQLTVPTNVTPGTLLTTIVANPVSAPRLQATASQFDSWYGNMTMEVETTGNSFSQDYVVLRHVPNGDPSRLPTNATNLLNLAETYENRAESTKLQLDSNRIASVTARWSSSYNRKKPILDTDPSECNNGLFIVVADGSPGTASVNLTVRLRYDIHFYGPVVVPQIRNDSQLFTGVVPLTAANFLGTTPTTTGPGSATASGNIITFPLIGEYIVTTYATGTGLVAHTAAFANASALTPSYTNVSSGTVAMGTWNIRTTAVNATMTLTTPATVITSSLVQINPLRF